MERTERHAAWRQLRVERDAEETVKAWQRAQYRAMQASVARVQRMLTYVRAGRS